MDRPAKFVIQIQAWLDLVKMWWRYRSGRYEVTRQWFGVGSELEPAQAYREIQQFVKAVVGTAPRPYGHGAYTVVVAAIWPEPDPAERREFNFSYPERLTAYRQISDHLAGWEPAPVAVMVGILPHGALWTGRPPTTPKNL